MTRTDWLKIGYVAAFVVVATAAGGVYYFSDGNRFTMVVTVVALLIPGRIQGYFYRDLFRGRRLFDEQELEASLRNTNRFLDFIREQPKLKRLLWLSWSIYTVDSEAMALNNVGAARMELGEWDPATAAFHEALAIDPKYPMPYFNLALLAEVRGNRTEAQRFLAEAVARGYRGTRIDDLIKSGQGLLARIEGRGDESE